MNFQVSGTLCRWRFVLLTGVVLSAHADELAITREYWLKNADAASMIQALNIVIRNPAKRRIMGGQGKHLVVTDLPEQQSEISEIIPVMDQPTTQTKPQRIIMEMVGRAGMYMRNNQKATVLARKSDTSAASAPAPASVPTYTSGTNSYGTFKSTGSIYAEEDAKLLKQSRHIIDEPTLLSLSDLALKGIFEPTKGKRMALLSAGIMLYTAHDGGLFESNRSRLKDVTSEVLADRVILTGPDRIPRTFKFKSTL